MGTVALAALAIGDVALVAAAMRPPTPPPTSRTAPPVFDDSVDTDNPDPAATAPTTSEPSPADSSPAASPTAATNLAAAPLRRLVVALDSTHAWRVTVGSCRSGGATVAVTGDGGRTWTTRTAPSATVVRLRATSASSAFAIGATHTCAAELRSTTDGGASWRSGAGLASSWYRDPAQPAELHRPHAGAVLPCGSDGTVVDLMAMSGAQARVLCGDGSVLSSTDSGSTWESAGSAPGAVAAAATSGTSPDTWLAVPSTGDVCTGISLVRAANPSAPVGCAAVALDGVAPGDIALSVSGSAGWLLVGDRTYRSTDSLRTWHPA